MPFTSELIKASQNFDKILTVLEPLIIRVFLLAMLIYALYKAFAGH